ncbi:MAG: hypothetical protein ACOYBC_05445 [Bilifractor sp.]|jgi:hypothetical protein
MKEFTEFEKGIAKNIHGYRWIARDYDNEIFLFRNKPYKSVVRSKWFVDNMSIKNCSTLPFPNLFQSIKWYDSKPTLIKDIYDPKILDEAEKRYLRNVINPIRNKVNCVIKRHFDNYEYIIIGSVCCDDSNIVFPCFEEGKMYKGMELNREYSFDELGLFKD